jgi:poly-beta-1,6-N-acetyl-D-glucosamine biosynthesis protein PgaD
MLLWAGYFYLMRHALSVVLSYFGFSARWGLQFDDISVPPILNDIQAYALVVAINSAVFIAWAVYNKRMFGSRNRRRRAAPATADEVGAHFLLPTAQIESCQAARRMVMVHNGAGQLIQCDIFDQAK